MREIWLAPESRLFGKGLPSLSGQIWRKPLRLWLRWSFRLLPSTSFRSVLQRLPFSRFAGWVRWCFEGWERIDHHGVRLVVNPGEKQGYYAYFLADYANAELSRLVELCRDAKVLADVGANAGWMSLIAAHANPQLRVFAFEPQPDALTLFRENLRLNPGLSARVTIVGSAVAEKKGAVNFRVGRVGNPGEGRIEEGNGSDCLKVPILRLDSFFSGNTRKPDVVKIDVEGAETRVLEGMKGLFQEGFPKSLMVETHGFYFGSQASDFNSEVVHRLLEAGFTLSRLDAGRWVPLSAKPLAAASRAHLLALRK